MLGETSTFIDPAEKCFSNFKWMQLKQIFHKNQIIFDLYFKLKALNSQILIIKPLLMHLVLYFRFYLPNNKIKKIFSFVIRLSPSTDKERLMNYATKIICITNLLIWHIPPQLCKDVKLCLVDFWYILHCQWVIRDRSID